MIDHLQGLTEAGTAKEQVDFEENMKQGPICCHEIDNNLPQSQEVGLSQFAKLVMRLSLVKSSRFAVQLLLIFRTQGFSFLLLFRF